MFDNLLDLSHCDSISIILLSGLVSAFVSLIVHFVREISDYVRKDKESKQQLFENSIEPLINAFENLLWRLTEIIDSECLYFEDIADSNVYLDYKKKSTLYRLSVVFGQIYLLKHEKRFTALSRLYPDLKDRLQRFGSVLSDGSWLDECNTKQVCKLMGIDPHEQIEGISVRI